MARAATRRAERPLSRRLRDSGVLVMLVLVLVLAIGGLVSGVAAVAGVDLIGGHPTKAALEDPSKSLVKAAEARAAAIVAHARQQATTDRAASVATAEKNARRIVHSARVRARHIEAIARRYRRHHRKGHRGNGAGGSNRGQGAGGQPTAVVPTLAAPTPTATPSIPSIPGVPASWVIVVYGVNPSTGVINIENRGYRAYSGIVTVSFYGRSGKRRGGRSGSFNGVPARSVTTITLPPFYNSYVRDKVSVSNIH